jgi:hypothetical protein
LLDLILFGGQQSVASSFLSVYPLFLLVLNPAFSLYEFLHRLFPETQDELIKSLSEILVVHLLIHRLCRTEIYF